MGLAESCGLDCGASCVLSRAFARLQSSLVGVVPVPNLTCNPSGHIRYHRGVGTRALGPDEEYLHARVTTWYEDCRKGWNTKSHMSERDYDRACQRMARERIKFLSEEENTRARAR